MRILFLYPILTKRHIRKDLGEIPLFLSRIGHDVEILTYTHRGIPSEYIRSIKLVSIRGRLPQKSHSNLFTYLLFSVIRDIQMVYMILRGKKRFECIFSYLRGSILASIILKMLKNTTIFIVKLDSYPSLWYTSKTASGIVRRIIGKLLFRILSRISDLLIIESPGAKEKLLYLHPFLKQKLIVLPNGIDTDLLKNLTDSVLPSSLVSRGDIVLTVADVTPVKGLDLLLNAFRRVEDRFPTWKVRVVGKIIDVTYKTKLDKLILFYNLKDKVTFTGELDGTSLVREYMTADIFCLPSQHEAFSMALLEAMYFGLPIITSNVGAAEFCLASGKAGLIFRKGEIDELASVLEILMSNKDLRVELGNNAKERCMKLFDGSTLISKLNDELCKLIKVRKR